MYFLVNNQNLVVAASEKFLSTIGARDVCSVSHILNDKSIILDEENKEATLTLNDLVYEYETSKLLSAFGELTVYRLVSKQTKHLELEDNDNISYLKKIKKGEVKKEDEEFDIPTISTNKEAKTLKTNKEDTPKILPSLEDSKETTNIENKETLDVIEEVKKDEKQKEIQELEPIESNESLTTEAKEIEPIELTKNIKEETSLQQNEEQNLEILEEIKDIKVKDTELEDFKALNDVSESLDTKDIQKEFNIPPIPQEEEKEIEEKYINIETPTLTKDNTLEENKEKPTTIKKLFPWGKKRDNKEDNDTQLNEKTLDENRVNLEQQNDNIDEIDEILKEIEEIEVKQTIKEDNKQTIPTIIESIKQTEQEPTLTEEQKDLKQNLDEKTANIETLKNIIKQIEEDENKTKQKKYEIISNIDLNKNADKLSLELTEYKSLLKRYLNEIKNYETELIEGSDKTIDMLIDAGQLLSLNELTNKIKELKIVVNKNATVSELLDMVYTLEEKLESTKSSENIIDVAPIPDDLADVLNLENILKSIKPQQIDFNPQIAASDLSLPKDLIFEFVKDFVAQSKEHLTDIIRAYNNKELELINSTAHMLKGAANNLRLTPIADNLFKLQKTQSLKESLELIKKFVAQIKGLELEIKKMESKDYEN